MLKPIEKEIAQIKARLISKAKRQGISENFGQKEVRKLRDSYNFSDVVDGTPAERAGAMAINEFEEWSISYTV